MPHRDRTTIDIHRAGIKSEFPRRGDPHRRECLVDLHQIQILRLEPLRAHAFAIARAGCDCNVESGPATAPCAPISATQVRPNSSALARLITTTAAAPSEICDALPR